MTADPAPTPPPRIAFFPWLRLQSEVSVGRFRLIRYDRREVTSGLTPEQHERVRNTLKTHRGYGAKELESATLAVVDGNLIVEDFSEPLRAEFFEFREVLAFSSLAARDFARDTSTSNRAMFAAVIAPLAHELGHVAVTTRSRAGPGLHIWDADHLVTVLPAHADRQPRIDVRLLTALWAARSNEQWTAILDAIYYFNAANTDSDDVDEPFEVVLTVAAFQRLLETKHLLDEALKALQLRFDTVFKSRLERASVAEATGDALRQTNCRPVLRWWKEINRVRGAQAHGARHPKSVVRTRSDTEHLLLAAWFFPRLLKMSLADRKLYEPTIKDLGEFEAFPNLLRLPLSSPRTRERIPAFEHSACDDIIDRSVSRWRHVQVFEDFKANGFVKGVSRTEDGTTVGVDLDSER